MTKFILIRHGKPDYSSVEERNFKGHGCDLAFLSKEGIEQAVNVSKNVILNNSDMLISSPYTRCMQTASIISNYNNLMINGEMDIHEWLPDLSFNYQTYDVVKDNYKKAIQDFERGNLNSKQYESIINVKLRALDALKKYLNYSKVIVVTHGGVIYSLCQQHVSYCEVVDIEYDGKHLIKSK